MKLQKDPNDKYQEYEVDFHGLIDHTEKEDEGEAEINNWHSRHRDKNLDEFCDNHPSAPQCKVFDD